MATKIGTFVILKLATKTLVGQSDLSYNNAITMIEVSSKSSGNDSDFVAGRSNKTLSLSGVAGTSAEETETGYWEMEALAEARTPIAFTIAEYTDKTATEMVIGSKIRSGNALIAKASLTFPDNAKNTFSCDLQVTGALNADTEVPVA
jgi:hypothetical protein